MSQATDMLQKYVDAEAAVLAGKIVRWGDRELRYEELNFIQDGRREWQAKVNAEALAGAGKSTARIAFADFSGRCK